MNSRTLSLTAIALWVILVTVLAVMFVRGQTVALEDGRTAVMLSDGEREAVLAEMRHMLDTVQKVTAALAENNMAQAAEAARASGTAAAADMNPALMTKLPLEFKQFGMSVHARFDELAAAAENGMGRDRFMAEFANQLSSCVACHETYALRLSQ